MSGLTIVLPYPEVEKRWNVWAESEWDIDFRRERLGAERCTACFAAFELKRFLAKMDHQLGVIEDIVEVNHAAAKLQG